MNAIVGLVAKPPFLAAPRASKIMLDRVHAPASLLAHAWQEGRVALGVRSRAPVDECLHADPRFVVVADARLDNRTELCAALGLPLSKASNAALVAAAFRAWGEASPGRLLGEFAFAIWDRSAESLFCARDRFGVKPLYYRMTERSFRFASTIGALAADADLAGLPLDDLWVVDFSAGLVTDRTATPYEGIRRLPPAHHLRCAGDRLSIEKYWSFDLIGPISTDLNADAVRTTLSEAVSGRMSATGVAAFLSGGLDSSSICCLARKELAARSAQDLTAVSIVFDETPEESERHYIEAVLAGGHISPVFVGIPDYRPLGSLSRMLEIQDGPFLAPGLPLMDHAYQAVAAGGFDAVLDGHGGDEVISFGIGRLHELARAGAWLRLLKEISALGAQGNENVLSMFASYVGFHGRGLTARACRGVLSWLRSARQPSPSVDWISEQWQDDKTAQRHASVLRSDPKFFQSERDHHIAVLSGPLSPYGFETLSHISRSHGLESRFPFWDQRTVELCLRFPSSAKLSGGHTRALLRSAMNGILPEAVRQRADKLEFSTHFVRGLVRDSVMLRDMSLSRNSGVDRFVNLSAFSQLIDQLEHPDRAVRAGAAALVWRGAALGLWLASRQSASRRSLAPLESQN